jgi:glycosyltransferase involved in cell wall biosynthesis
VECRHGIQIFHPRFLAVPKLTSWINPLSMALSALPVIRRMQREAPFDVIDAHFVYPDGAAAVLLGAWLGKPVTVTARGTDINEFPQFPVPRRWIKWVLRRADALITVSAALRTVMLDLSAPPERTTVLRNGVDLSLFAPLESQADLDLASPVLLSVGHLIPDKGHQFVIEALVDLPEARLVVVGDGPMREELKAMASDLGVSDRITWTGTLAQDALAREYAMADATVLASRLEGMPNVLLESIACGTPVIATNVGGSAEVISSPAAGVLMAERSATAVVTAVRQLASNRPSRQDVRSHAEQFGWGPTAQGLLQIFARLGAGRSTRSQRRISTAHSG